MSDFNALADAFADMVWERLKERVEETCREVFISGIATHGLADTDDVSNMIREAIESHLEEETHHDDERMGEAVNEALAETLRTIANSL